MSGDNHNQAEGRELGEGARWRAEFEIAASKAWGVRVVVDDAVPPGVWGIAGGFPAVSGDHLNHADTLPPLDQRHDVDCPVAICGWTECLCGAAARGEVSS